MTERTAGTCTGSPGPRLPARIRSENQETPQASTHERPEIAGDDCLVTLSARDAARGSAGPSAEVRFAHRSMADVSETPVE